MDSEAAEARVDAEADPVDPVDLAAAAVEVVAMAAGEVRVAIATRTRAICWSR